MYLRFSDKVIYLGNKTFLPANHPLIRDTYNLPVKAEEHESPPKKKVYRTLIGSHLAYEGARNKTHAKSTAKESGCKGISSFMLLPGHDRTKQAFPDPMHTIPNAIQALFKLMTGKDNAVKVRKAENEAGRFGAACEINESSLEGKLLL